MSESPELNPDETVAALRLARMVVGLAAAMMVAVAAKDGFSTPFALAPWLFPAILAVAAWKIPAGHSWAAGAALAFMLTTGTAAIVSTERGLHTLSEVAMCAVGAFVAFAALGGCITLAEEGRAPKGPATLGFAALCALMLALGGWDVANAYTHASKTAHHQEPRLQEAFRHALAAAKRTPPGTEAVYMYRPRATSLSDAVWLTTDHIVTMDDQGAAHVRALRGTTWTHSPAPLSLRTALWGPEEAFTLSTPTPAGTATRFVVRRADAVKIADHLARRAALTR